MRDALSTVLAEQEEESTDRILAAAFFRKRPLQAGTTPISLLADRKARAETTTSYVPTNAWGPFFLAGDRR